MSVHPYPKKPGVWYIAYRPDGRKGRQVRVPFEGTQEEALLLEAELRRQNRTTPLSAFPRLEEAAPDYMAWYRLSHLQSGAERTARSLQHILGFFGRYQFTAIAATMVDKYKARRLEDGVKPTTINKELACLSGFCRWAHRQGFCQPVKVERFPNKMTRAPLPDVPTRAEVLALITAMIWPRCGLVACLYFGGMRVGEAVGLTVERVSLAMGVMIVTGKGNKERVIPIAADLLPYLVRRLSEVPGGRLWETGQAKRFDLRASIEAACKRAGITRHIHPHLLRHAFGVHCTEAGMGLRSLQQIMGHSTSQVTELYSRLAAEALKREMAKYGGGGLHSVKS